MKFYQRRNSAKKIINSASKPIPNKDKDWSPSLPNDLNFTSVHPIIPTLTLSYLLSCVFVTATIKFLHWHPPHHPRRARCGVDRTESLSSPSDVSLSIYPLLHLVFEMSRLSWIDRWFWVSSSTLQLMLLRIEWIGMCSLKLTDDKKVDFESYINAGILRVKY